jgi:hypothetical protein
MTKMHGVNSVKLIIQVNDSFPTVTAAAATATTTTTTTTTKWDMKTVYEFWNLRKF